MVALSALPLDNDADWRLAGFAGHVAKPISVGEFSEQVGRYCVPAEADAAAAPSSGVPVPLHKQAGMVGRVAASSYRRLG